MRVLVGAFACRPDSGSETGAGWAVVKTNARLGHQTVLITQHRHRDGIEAALREDEQLATSLTVVYAGLPARIMDTWDRVASLRGLQLYNLAWQLRLGQVARRLHRRLPFDVAHHVTLSTDWIPTGFALVPGLRVVWGPLGGSERVPRACRRFLGARGRMTEALRILGPVPLRSFARRAARRCALLIAQNDAEAQVLRRSGRPVDVRPNVFLEPAFGARGTPVSRATDPDRRAVYVGRLLAWKGVHLAVATMAEPTVSDWTLDMFGSGPERRRLQRSIAKRDLGSRVTLRGQRTRSEIRSALLAADVLLFPSMREAAGWVVAEAVAVGCPVVCLDVGGPPLIIGDAGIAVRPGPHLPASLAQALVEVRARPRQIVEWDDNDLGAQLKVWYGRATATTESGLGVS